MRLLLIDDLREVEAAAGWDVTIARTPAEGLEQIIKGWDLLLLDHDLGDVGDVRPIVRLLEERVFLGDPIQIGRIVVVSSNPVGAEWIAAGLRRTYSVEVRPAPRVIIVPDSGL
jgi:hypothetical protein